MTGFAKTAKFTEGSLIAIGNTPFRQTQFKGNGCQRCVSESVNGHIVGRERSYLLIEQSEVIPRYWKTNTI
jgi:hypothetical protein